MHKFPDIGRRLKRANGHLDGIIAMLEEGRPCMELAQQLHAVEKAIGNAKKTLIRDHLQHCISETAPATPREIKALIAEFEGIAKYL